VHPRDPNGPTSVPAVGLAESSQLRAGGSRRSALRWCPRLRWTSSDQATQHRSRGPRAQPANYLPPPRWTCASRDVASWLSSQDILRCRRRWPVRFFPAATGNVPMHQPSDDSLSSNPQPSPKAAVVKPPVVGRSRPRFSLADDFRRATELQIQRTRQARCADAGAAPGRQLARNGGRIDHSPRGSSRPPRDRSRGEHFEEESHPSSEVEATAQSILSPPGPGMHHQTHVTAASNNNRQRAKATSSQRPPENRRGSSIGGQPFSRCAAACPAWATKSKAARSRSSQGLGLVTGASTGLNASTDWQI